MKRELPKAVYIKHGASSEEDMCRISGKPVEWLDEPGLTPEDAADDELSYWEIEGATGLWFVWGVDRDRSDWESSPDNPANY